MKKSIQLNAVLSTTKTVLSLVISLVTFPYITRILQVEAVGKHDFAVSIVKYFVLLAELGVFTYAVREGTKLREDRGRFSVFASEILVLQTLSSAVSLLLLIISALAVPKLQGYWALLFILSLQIPLTAFSRSWIYNVYEDFGYITLTQFVFQILSLVLLFAFVRTPDDLYIYSVTYLISHAGANILHGLRSRKYMAVVPIRFKNLKLHIKPVLIIFFMTISVTIYVNSDVTILGWLVGDEAVGLYSISVKVYNIVKQVITAVITVAIPRLTLYAGTDKFKDFFNRVLKTLALIILPAMAGLFLLSDNIVEIIGGPEYLAASYSLQILSIALVFSLFACLYASGALVPNMQEKPFLIATIISAAVNIILNFILIPVFHQNAAAITTLVAEFVTLIICYYCAKKYAPLEGLRKTLLPVGVGCVVIVAVCLGIKSLNLSLFPETILCVVASVIAYCSSQLVLKNEIFMQTLCSARNILAKKHK